MFKNLFETKSVDSLIKDSGAEDNQNGLKRILGPVSLVSFGIGSIIGAGIFIITGQAAAQYAGPAIVYSFLFSAIACIFFALCYAEFSSIIPTAGSSYSYVYASLGEFCAWLIGWDLTLVYLFIASAVASGWSGYAVSFLKDIGVFLPLALTSAPIEHLPEMGWKLTGAIINLPAALLTFAVTILLISGIEKLSFFNNLTVIVKVVVILLFIVFGISYISLENLTPFIPQNTGQFGHFGWSGVLRGAGIIFFSYMGFDVVTTLAQESKNPQRNIPIGVIGSLIICSIIYVLVALVLTGIVRYDQLNVPDPLAVGVNAAGHNLYWLRPLIKIGAVIGLSSVVLSVMLSQSRIFFSMSRDGLLPKLFSSVHKRFRTPHWSSVVVGICSIILSGFIPLSVLGELVSMGALLYLGTVCVAVMILRFTQPNVIRPFKTPFVWLVSPLGVITALVQMVALPGYTWLRFAIWMTIGIAIYFVYSQKHSKLRK
jgi:basic amino acid/polyamine antiporter, APA family